MSRLESLSRNAMVLAQRSALSLVGLPAPSIAGQWATKLFLATRRGRSRTAPAAPLGATTIRVGNGTGRDAYVWGHSGAIVVLIHGWGSDSAAMCSLVRPLRERGYRVVAFDAPAHGVNHGNKTTMTEFVAAVREVLDQFEPTASLRAIVGHSLGGLAAVAAVRSARRLPQRLVLVSAPSSLNEALRGFVGFWQLSRAIQDCIRDELSRSHGVPIEHWDVRTLADRDRFPALVVHDRKDQFVPVDEARIVAGALGETTRVEVTEGLGHARILGDRRTTALVAEFVAADG